MNRNWLMPEHKIHCPSCEQHLAVPEELAGEKIDCPACNKPMAIPDFAHAFDEPEEEEPAGESSSRKSPALIAGIAGVVRDFVKKGVATPYDQVVAGRIAEVLTGGEADLIDTVTEDQLLKLERQQFMASVKDARTQARVEHMLETGKPLRN